MNKKEISEIRRRFKPDYDNISRVYGCYVNAGREIVSEMDMSVGLMSQDETEMYLKVLKKTLSGTPGRNLIDIEFTTAQVENSEEHKMLQALRLSHLEDEGLRQALYARMIDVLDPGEAGYVILLASDSYDVPYKGKDDEVFRENSDEVFDYFICAVCPVKPGKAELIYQPSEQIFRESSLGTILTPPTLGFMFPAFDDRAANIYDLLYYSRAIDDIHEDFIQTMFGVERAPMSAGDQQAAFCGALMDSLGENCSLDVVVAVHENIRARLEEYQESKEPDPPEIYVEDMDKILTDSGVPSEKVETFHNAVEDSFSDMAAMNPSNLVETKKFKLDTEGVKIQIDPDYIDGIRTEYVDGRKYILIPAGGSVEINGIEVSVGGPEEE